MSSYDSDGFPAVRFSAPFPLPTWKGMASISGRFLTRVSGDSFTDGFPGLGVWFKLKPGTFLAFRTYYVDANTLKLGIDSGSELLVPLGYYPTEEPPNFKVCPLIWPQFFSAIGFATGSAITSDPNKKLAGHTLTLHQEHPEIKFGGDHFELIQGGIAFIRDSSGIGEYSITVNDSLNLTASGSFSGQVQVLWKRFGISPSTDLTLVTINANGAYPVGSPAHHNPQLIENLQDGALYDSEEVGASSVFAGDSIQLSAQIISTNPVSTEVTWAVTDGPGSVSTSGVYTAPTTVSNLGMVHATVTATSAADTSKSADFYIEIDSRNLRTVDIDPATYVPPTGWKLSGDSGRNLAGGLKRKIIVPV